MSSRIFAIWLWSLLGLFCARVLAQIVQFGFDVPFLPPFDAWQSGVLPYPLLVAAQVLIAVFMAWIAAGVLSGRVVPSRARAVYWLAPGCLYLAVMIVRLALGLTLLDGHGWFDRPLPTGFHIVLASFLLVVGAYHRSEWRPEKAPQP